MAESTPHTSHNSHTSQAHFPTHDIYPHTSHHLHPTFAAWLAASST
ncbi:MAG: hypothetical protein HDS65_08660 [Bacteroidales bacterium]|nr:hypothetical protein [Bacteroidales bacterium]